MRRILIGAVVAAGVAGGAWYYRSSATGTAAEGTVPGSTSRAGGAGSGRAGGRGAMTVDTALVSRHEISDSITVVGNLIGEATVDVVPRTAGRIESVLVKLGDRVTKGQTVVKIEDRAIREQVNQVQANIDVNDATVVSRENDAKVAQNSLDRARTSFERGLLSKQGLEDAESRYNSAVSQVTVAKAQLVSTKARLDELSVTLSDTTVLSPVDGFVGKRNLDQGAFAGANTPVISVVDIGVVRLVANLVEKDFRRIDRGGQALVEVDAFPGEQFTGQVSRVSPVFDPATRTAAMEIEVPNPGFRLKPGMYARVKLITGRNANALTVPRAAVVDIDAKRGVFVLDKDVVKFTEIESGMSDGERVEILKGLSDGARVVTTGALAIRDGDRVQVTGAGGAGGARGGRGAANAGATPTGARAAEASPAARAGTPASRGTSRGAPATTAPRP
ncbi:MAG: efflux RND transporter periplasmic adaptor subunit [Acidobacteriota bacterium]